MRRSNCRAEVLRVAAANSGVLMLPPALIPLTWLVLLLRYPKRTLAIGLPIVLTLASIAGWLILDQHSNQRRLDRLDMQITYAPTECTVDAPLRVQLRNSTDQSLINLKWRIAAYRPDFSPLFKDASA